MKIKWNTKNIAWHKVLNKCQLLLYDICSLISPNLELFEYYKQYEKFYLTYGFIFPFEIPKIWWYTSKDW